MLGRFLEFSVATPDIAASLRFYAGLGFSAAGVGDTWQHPYAVLSDGRVCIGLHQGCFATPQITFVKPHLLQQIAALERLGIEFETRRLGSNVFNEIAWRDPCGHLIRLIEARTFSPVRLASAAQSACGHFLEIALPTAYMEAAKTYWESLGFVGMDEAGARLAHVCCMSDTINVGLYDPQDLSAPTLVFDADDLPKCVAQLAQLGIQAERPLPGTPGSRNARGAALFVAPEGTPILVQSSATA
ncbi:MAG: VOC family protein [Steroidobacterales bacterium]